MNTAVKKEKIENSILELRKEIAVPRKIFSRLLSVSERSLADLERSKRPPSEAVQRKLNELSRLVTELHKTIAPGFLQEWFMKPNSAFGDLKPIDVIERGEIDRIWRMIYFIRSGSPT
ncbi:MAG TPA: hypothetical protein ENI77_02005 [Nitrospirae bacterium]|nr:hypothetical protein [Nitrospirota bacterium]